MKIQKTKTKKQETIRLILAAASDVFSEVGFSGARMDAIAARAQVNKATIYYHIGDKRALYAAVLHNVFSNLASRISQEIGGFQTPNEKLRAFIQNFAQVLDQHPHLPSIMMREVASGGRDLPDIVVQDMAKLFSMMKEILKQGMDEGVFKPVSPFVIHMMVVGSMVFYKASGTVRTRHSTLPETVRQMATNVSGKIADEIEALIVGAVKK